jgi:hypothetical protein
MRMRTRRIGLIAVATALAACAGDGMPSPDSDWATARLAELRPFEAVLATCLKPEGVMADTLRFCPCAHARAVPFAAHACGVGPNFVAFASDGHRQAVVFAVDGPPRFTQPGIPWLTFPSYVPIWGSTDPHPLGGPWYWMELAPELD